MFCDLGGVLGLYVGFSIMTIFEFFELFGSLVWICVVRLYRGPTPAAASVTRVGDSTVVRGDKKDAFKMQSPRPPDYDGLSSDDQFQLFTTTKNLPNVHC